MASTSLSNALCATPGEKSSHLPVLQDTVSIHRKFLEENFIKDTISFIILFFCSIEKFNFLILWFIAIGLNPTSKSSDLYFNIHTNFHFKHVNSKIIALLFVNMKNVTVSGSQY